jgi:hypothetical protein
MSILREKVVKAAAVLVLATAALATAPAMASAHATTAAPAVIVPYSSGDGTPAGAIQWYQAHNGSTGWQGLCEKAVENAYGTTGVWASANAHWNGAPQHPGNYSPPLGAFVYWDVGSYGHVGISDGAGGFYASSVNGAIGHVTKSGGGYDYYRNVAGWNATYRGWTPAAVPSQ